MSRAYLFSLRIGHALREAISELNYGKSHLIKDILAGVTVGIIAIPLSMALAIASGVAPQYGLYTAIIAGFVIALTGGSRYSISGPTAAFVVILFPIAEKFGLGGLLMATVLSGLMLMLMAFFRLGRLIEYIPEPVTLGFTGGIAVVIATLQLKDFMGLSIDKMPESYLEKLETLALHMPDFHGPSLGVALLTLAVMLGWKKLKTPIPPHLPAVIIGSIAGLILQQNGMAIATVGSKFSYVLADGSTGAGIPPILPEFAWPWNQANAQGEALGFSWQMIKELLPAAFAIAMLGAIESLLCAVVLDGMSGKRHSANSELMGQGIGNVIVPFFGGISATAAIARSAANFKAGAQSPIAAMVHGLVVLLGLVVLADLLAYLPMPAMAALLMVVAWNMSEAPKSFHLLKTAPLSDIWVLISCFSLTIIFDMVIAITAGILLAAVLFMKEIADMTKVVDLRQLKTRQKLPLPEDWVAIKITGPLFFAAADRIFNELAQLSAQQKAIVMDWEGVTLLDAGGLASFQKLLNQCARDNTQVHLIHLNYQPLKTLTKAGIKPQPDRLSYHAQLEDLFTKLPALAKDSPMSL